MLRVSLPVKVPSALLVYEPALATGTGPVEPRCWHSEKRDLPIDRLPEYNFAHGPQRQISTPE